MLDNITKKNIDDCRDVLVGKVPDPKSQIEQITLALIYKFMDDMDKEAVEKFKGKAKFFTGTYSKYGWRKLFDPSLSGADMLALYSEALEKLNTNPNIPELFRNIFKNAYLPYRDPSTLKLFLKYINEFDYSHSEKLGDAFEYLLSVMGSQGDAGQFRTPRHIIDFVTACVNPQKNETVLDPACGTAGFLLSAYKHILRQNTDKRHGDKLTPDQRKKLAINFVGYDISPDMVRLSLANMYLHGFATPQIHEYDTLSSEDRWNETFDVILANPPFMTPKGGIRPHKKFGVQANKAEVLFTDYIGEHLNSNGRAGIIVPNGIVATTQTAYKQLRKLLVEDSLIAVISLPAGVFQPYSGVKTSVLLLDKQLAKKSNHILFLKIDNDGFDLGAQRREHDKNDLPLALKTLETFKECLSTDTTFDKLPSLATLVKKETVLENKDVVLNADRYFVNGDNFAEGFETVELGSIYTNLDGKRKPVTKSDRKTGIYPYYGASGIVDYVEDYIFDEELLLVSEDGANLLARSTPIAFSVNGKIWVNNHAHVLKFENRATQKYVEYFLNSIDISKYVTGAAQPKLNQQSLNSIEIPLPPLSIQQQIVNEIEGYQKIVNGAKQVVNNYKPTIAIKPEWEMVELGSIATQISSGATPLGGKENYKDSGILFIRSQNVLWGETDFSDAVFISKDTHSSMKRSQVKFEDVFLNITGASIGRSAVMKENIEANVNQHVVFIRTIKERLNPYFLSTFLNSPFAQNIIANAQTGAARQAINYEQIKELQIPLPSLEEQKLIVQSIEEEMRLVFSNKKLIELFEQKIKNKINEVWGAKEGNTYKIEQENLSMAAEPETK
jgi:type I restriction enzyme M protein